MSGFKSYSYQEAPRETFKAVPEGRYDVTVTDIECRRSGKGHPQMMWTETIDNGPEAGETLKDFFTFVDGSDIAWVKLVNICDACGFEFEEAGSLEAFAAQFPINKLRFSVDVEHRYSAKAWIDVDNPYNFTKFTEKETDETPYPHQINLEKTIWEKFDGEKSGPWAQVRDGLDFANIYGKPQAERELQFGEEDETAVAAEAVAAGAEDDDLPFKKRG